MGGSPTQTVLVTGAAGFIGSHVSQALLNQGTAVVALDNFNDYYAPGRKEANLREVRQSTRGDSLTVVEADIRDGAEFARVFADHRFNAIVHLASMAGVRSSVDHPHLYYDVNVMGTIGLLELARDFHVTNFILASTSSTYGNTPHVPFVETDSCDRPLAPYSASKRAAELIAYTYHHLYQQNITVLRFFSVYGPRGRPDMMPYKLADSIVSGRVVPLYAGGQMRRDWTYVDDIVAGIVAAVERPLGYEIINLGRGVPVLVSDFIRILEDLAGRKANLVDALAPQTELTQTWANIDKARSLLSYEPKTSVEEGVCHFWDWYQRTALPATEATRTIAGT